MGNSISFGNMDKSMIELAEIEFPMPLNACTFTKMRIEWLRSEWLRSEWIKKAIASSDTMATKTNQPKL